MSTPPVGLAGRVEDHQLGAFAQARPELVEVEAELVLLAQRNEDGPPADEVDHRLVDREAGFGISTSSPSSTSARMAKNMIGFPPGVTTTCSGRTSMPRLRATSSAMASRKLRDTGGRGVVRVPVAQRLAPGLDDVGRRIEVGLADLEVDDLASPPPEPSPSPGPRRPSRFPDAPSASPASHRPPLARDQASPALHHTSTAAGAMNVRFGKLRPSLSWRVPLVAYILRRCYRYVTEGV